jgi:putative AlgH/UPF0301 family transcriptional regulator
MITDQTKRAPVNATRINIDGHLERLAQLNNKLYFGGPVEITSVWFLFRADTPPEHAIQVLDDVYVSTNRELLRKLLDRDKPWKVCASSSAARAARLIA